jgi:hypothetical protein
MKTVMVLVFTDRFHPYLAVKNSFSYFSLSHLALDFLMI